MKSADFMPSAMRETRRLTHTGIFRCQKTVDASSDSICDDPESQSHASIRIDRSIFNQHKSVEIFINFFVTFFSSSVISRESESRQHTTNTNEDRSPQRVFTSCHLNSKLFHPPENPNSSLRNEYVNLCGSLSPSLLSE